MARCRDLFPMLVVSLLVMAWSVTYDNQISMDIDPFALVINHTRVRECFSRSFTAIWREVVNLRHCVRAMYQRQIQAMLLCEVYAHEVNITMLRLDMSLYHRPITDEDFQNFQYNISDAAQKLESCFTSMIDYYFSERKISSFHAFVARASGPQCVSGFQERVVSILIDTNKCLQFPTLGEKLLEHLSRVAILPQSVLLCVLFTASMPSVRRLSGRANNLAIAIMMAVMLGFVVGHFEYKNALTQYLFKIVASTGALSPNFLNRIHVVDLDEHIDRKPDDDDPYALQGQPAWRYLGEDVMLHCGIYFWFNTTVAEDDIEVEWFHNDQRLQFSRKHRVLNYTIHARHSRGFMSMVIAVKNLTLDDFGSYKCNISKRHQPFLLRYLDVSFSSNVSRIQPRIIDKSVMSGSMLKVKYSYFRIPDGVTDFEKRYHRVNSILVRGTLSQTVDDCNYWTQVQNIIYDLIISDGEKFSSSEPLIDVLSFCVPAEKFGRHQFVNEHFFRGRFEMNTHPVTLNVKNPKVHNQNNRQRESTDSVYFDFFTAASDLFDAILITLLGFLIYAIGSVVTFLSLLMFRQFMKKLLPFLGSRFLKRDRQRQKIYIAMSTHDRAWTKRNVVKFLESLGHPTFLPSRDCPPNQLEIQALSEGIASCQKYVVVLSSHSLGEESCRFERSLIVEELRRRGCCQDGAHPTCLLFVCLGVQDVPSPRLGGTVVSSAQARKRHALREELRSWRDETMFSVEEWNIWYLLCASILITVCQLYKISFFFAKLLLWENLLTLWRWFSPSEA